ncbi:MAG: hypothetical protein LUB61_07840 [Eggerthellaceae bacterium]|nr:hypothetical protein [Eggerthellaceae bacterium]
MEDLKAKGIKDPIACYQEEVKELNAKRKAESDMEKVRHIGDTSPELRLGYFTAKAVNDKLKLATDMGYLSMFSGLEFDVYEMLCDLICSRLMAPKPGAGPYYEDIPSLGEGSSYTADELFEGLSFLGQNYQKVIEIYNHHMEKPFGCDKSLHFFYEDILYFEAVPKGPFRREEESGGYGRDATMKMGIMLDSCLVPVGMELVPESAVDRTATYEFKNDLEQRF